MNPLGGPAHCIHPACRVVEQGKRRPGNRLPCGCGWLILRRPILALVVKRSVRMTEMESRSTNLARSRRGRGTETTRNKRTGDPRNDGLCHGRIEVHEHVAAEYDVLELRLPELREVVREISLLEAYGPAYCGIQHETICIRAKPASSQGRWQVAQRPIAVSREARLCERRRIMSPPGLISCGCAVNCSRIAMANEYGSSPEAQPAERHPNLARSRAGCETLWQCKLDECPNLIGAAIEVGFSDRELLSDLA